MSLDKGGAAHRRLIALERGFNLRDFGGYPTETGASVREGVLFRSGTMAYLSEADNRRMLDLGLAAIIDLRRADERALEPTEWYAGTDLDYWAGTHTTSSGILREAIGHGGLGFDRMVELYRKLPYDHAASYRSFFLKIRDGALPILVNCAAGKDRTGVAVALLLAVLGVSRELIFEDYCLTNEHADFVRMMAFREQSGRFKGVLPDALGPMFAADRAYLTAMFEQIDAQHGTIEHFVLDELHLEAGDLEAIRSRLVQTP